MDTMREEKKERRPRMWFQWQAMASFNSEDLERARQQGASGCGGGPGWAGVSLTRPPTMTANVECKPGTSTPYRAS